MSEHPMTYATILKSKGLDEKKFLKKYPFFKSVEDKNQLVKWIVDKTPLLSDPCYSFGTKCYWIANGLTDFPICKYEGCNKKIGVGENTALFGEYSDHCCNAHAVKDVKTQQKMKATKKRKYGDENFNNRDKAARTCEETYGKGIVNPSQVQSVKDKKTATSLKHFGVTNPNKDKGVRAKIDKTNIKLYGAACPFASPIIQEKIAQTNLRLFGVRNVFELPEIAQLGLEGRIRKYGTARGNSRRYKYIDGPVLDSSWELYFLIYCLDHGLNISREPIRIRYTLKNGKKRWYYPDFMVGDKIYEVKGDNFFAKDGTPIYNGKYSWQEKYDCMMENNVIIIRGTDIKLYRDYVRSKYGKDYVKQFLIEPIPKDQSQQEVKSN